MTLALNEEHLELQRSVARWVERYCPPALTRAAVDAEREVLPAFWGDLVDQGWLVVHVPEALGGQGFGILELAVVLQELGRAIAPGPFLPSALAAAVVGAHAEEPAAKALLPGIVDGTTPAAVVFGATDSDRTLEGVGLYAQSDATGTLTVSGTVPAVLGGALARLLMVPVRSDGPGRPEIRWCAIDLSGGDGAPAAGVSVTPRASLDLTRRSAAVTLESVHVPPERVLAGVTTAAVLDLALVLAAAELSGCARWCLDAASEHARTRVQFGRPIGQFQGVKHKLADLLVAVEQLEAATWDAALALDGEDPDQAHLSAAAAGALAQEIGVQAARDTIQVLGGMGFTWEHDVHLYLRRAATLRQLLGGSARQHERVATLALDGVRRALGVELPAVQAESARAELAASVAEVAAAPVADQRRVLGERGLLFPHWPVPYGRGAGAVEQLVLDELLAEAGVTRPPSNVAAWALPTIISYGTVEQQERWVLPTLRGELVWCQLFSEPGAGSDLAALSTRATRSEGGWVLDGQKVWTSVAARANLGICLARTDPHVPKHQGITYFVVDMTSPGIEVRPLREITGAALFNEVFFDGCFVADDCVVGEVNGGWRLARTTLANERVSLGSDTAFGGSLESVMALMGSADAGVGDSERGALGRLLVDAQSLAVMAQRSVLRSLSGLEPGSEGSVRKLLGAEHEQRVADLGLELCGQAGVFSDGELAGPARQFLHTLCLTIAGGTSEVQRNVIGERLLRLPRDHEPPATGGGSTAGR
jgi:3-oxochol-4-en-24-oyl-CoA dehydrogenase